MTTQAAQRRLLEALATADRAGCDATPPRDALAEFALGLAFSRGLLGADDPHVAIFEAMEDLAVAVRNDHTQAADEVRFIETGDA